MNTFENKTLYEARPATPEEIEMHIRRGQAMRAVAVREAFRALGRLFVSKPATKKDGASPAPMGVEAKGAA